MNSKTMAMALCVLLAGCSISPFSPAARNRINGDVGEIRNNQNGIMSEIAGLKNRLDVIARDVENLQSGLMNSNNKNYGVQIFQGDGGLAVGLVLATLLGGAAVVYKIKSDKYKKAAKILGEQIKKMNDPEIEERVFAAALEKKVEKPVYEALS